MKEPDFSGECIHVQSCLAQLIGDKTVLTSHAKLLSLCLFSYFSMTLQRHAFDRLSSKLKMLFLKNLILKWIPNNAASPRPDICWVLTLSSAIAGHLGYKSEQDSFSALIDILIQSFPTTGHLAWVYGYNEDFLFALPGPLWVSLLSSLPWDIDPYGWDASKSSLCLASGWV